MKENTIPQFIESVSRTDDIQRLAEIIVRENRCALGAQPQDIGKGLLLFDKCSESEKAFIGKLIPQEDVWEEALETARVLSQLSTNAFKPAENHGAPWFSPLIVPQLSKLLGHSRPSGKEKMNEYWLMQTLLQRVNLRCSDDRFYMFDGYVYRQVPDLDALVFACLEPEISAGNSSQILSRVQSLLKANCHIKVNPLMEPSNLLHFLNGSLNIETREFRPPTPDVFFASFLDFSCTFDVAECPIFDLFLNGVAGGDPEIIQAVWEMLGYLLVPDMAGKAFFILQGVGDSGKSVLGALIASFFNPESVSYLDIFRFKDRFSTSALRGKRLNVCLDLPDGRISKEAVGVIKMITGDDTITIEEKFKNSRPFKPTCKLLFATNHRLWADPDPAFEARCIVIPFRHPVPKAQQDKGLLAKLKAERPAIVLRALNAYNQLRSRGYQFLRLTDGHDIMPYVPCRDQMRRFLDECCVFEGGLFTFTSALQQAYNSWCESYGMDGLYDLVQFSRQLNRYCCGRIIPHRKRYQGENLNGYSGIGLKQAAYELNFTRAELQEQAQIP